MEAIQIFLVMIGILVVVMIVNPTMIATLLIAILFFGLIIKLYLRPSQDLKRLEGICKFMFEFCFISALELYQLFYWLFKHYPFVFY